MTRPSRPVQDPSSAARASFTLCPVTTVARGSSSRRAKSWRSPNGTWPRRWHATRRPGP